MNPVAVNVFAREAIRASPKAERACQGATALDRSAARKTPHRRSDAVQSRLAFTWYTLSRDAISSQMLLSCSHLAALKCVALTTRLYKRRPTPKPSLEILTHEFPLHYANGYAANVALSRHDLCTANSWQATVVPLKCHHNLASVSSCSIRLACLAPRLFGSLALSRSSLVAQVNL